VECAPQLTKLPLDMDLAGVCVLVLQADRLALAQAFSRRP
jgi:hypothetical protein